MNVRQAIEFLKDQDPDLPILVWAGYDAEETMEAEEVTVVATDGRGVLFA